MNKILKMVGKIVEPGDLYGFYKAVYNGTPCGPSIGFRVNGEWLYCSELPSQLSDEDVVDGVSVSSIVEGWDGEIEGVKFDLEVFQEEDFWKMVGEINEEAGEIWVLVNSDWFLIEKDGQPVAGAHWEEWDDNITWDTVVSVSEEEKNLIEEELRKRHHIDKRGVVTDPLDLGPMEIGGFVVKTYDPSATLFL